MIQKNPHEEKDVQKVERDIEELQMKIDLEERLIAELDQQLAESKREYLSLKHDMEVARSKLTMLRMKPITIGS